MPAPMYLNAAAFISPQNHPILVRNFTSSKQDDLKYNYVAHTSLDVIEERRMLTPNAKHNECYLGLLYSMEDLAVYGYVTPTRLKIVIALASSDAVVRDADVVLVFKALHSAYRRSVSNPFLKMHSAADADAATLLSGDGTNRFEMFKQRVDEVGRAVNNPRV
ncbi:trafficking protein particle complex 2 [Hysterangium stoloniferum]|nr:trafficking protein particle complex 2 [Hysterangium stoloniferum]